jgi:hypothetical protein
MKFPISLFLFLLLICPIFSQTHERVTFRYQAESVVGSVFVSGDLPQFGGNDFGRSVELVQIDNGIWEVVVSLPVNRSYQYQFLARNTNTS